MILECCPKLENRDQAKPNRQVLVEARRGPFTLRLQKVGEQVRPE